MTMYRPTWAEIDLNHLWHNYQLAQEKIPNRILIPVIKANAYGHGAVEIMQHLYDHGVRHAAVSLLEEALELRTHFRDLEILMLGPILPKDLRVASEHHIEITLYDQTILDAVIACECWISCHLKVDTGMSRYGFVETNQIVDAIEILQTLPHVSFKGIYTHFATANDDQTFFDLQLDRFQQILKSIKTLPPMVHVSNSSSIFKYESTMDFTTHARLGISLYGLILDQDKHQLKPVMSLKTQVVQIKHLKANDCVGYGATYCAKADEIIAILPIGYADGFHRGNKNGLVEINQKTYPLIGIICMDACFVKIDETIKVGDVVTLFGGLVSIDQVAKHLKTINYEVCTSVSSRVPRIYRKGESHD